ncbi:glycosyltransferase [Kiritimatiellaeota bacterium B1221]|nr:glycosyltransferase [Kiritimatiellaeota bacterium B1221]
MSEVEFPPDIKAGLCHDWLTGMRGGERVLELLADAFPDAPIFTLIHKHGAVSDRIESHPVHSSPLQKIPGIYDHYRIFLPVMPMMVRAWKPSADLDVVISTSHCVAKSIKTQPGTRHVCYCFTPMRYAWLFHEDYFPHPIKRILLKPVLATLRIWDKNTAHRVDRFVAISEHVRKRIKEFYGRDADVVYPPADTDYFHPGTGPREEYDFLISAMVPYKKVDLAIRAYTASGYPLKVMGTGSGLADLQKIAGPNIEFLGRQPDETLREHYQKCRFLIFPGEEDYGIVPVEAMACGTPVIAYGRGGVTETVIAGESGMFFDPQTPEALNKTLEQAAEKDWDREQIRQRAEQFDVPHFLEGIARVLRT